jgi:hypothetical protein
MKKLVIFLIIALAISITANILLSFDWQADHLIMRSTVLNCEMDEHIDGRMNCSGLTRDGKTFDFFFQLPVGDKGWISSPQRKYFDI